MVFQRIYHLRESMEQNSVTSLMRLSTIVTIDASMWQIGAAKYCYCMSASRKSRECISITTGIWCIWPPSENQQLNVQTTAWCLRVCQPWGSRLRGVENGNPSRRTTTTESDDEKSMTQNYCCTLCLGDFGSSAIIMPCSHLFHGGCIFR